MTKKLKRMTRPKKTKIHKKSPLLQQILQMMKLKNLSSQMLNPMRIKKKKPRQKGKNRKSKMRRK
jgi:hypothetical protein